MKPEKLRRCADLESHGVDLDRIKKQQHGRSRRLRPVNATAQLIATSITHTHRVDPVAQNSGQVDQTRPAKTREQPYETTSAIEKSIYMSCHYASESATLEPCKLREVRHLHLPLGLVRLAPDPLGLYVRAGRLDRKHLQSFITSGTATFRGVVFEATRVARGEPTLIRLSPHRTPQP